MYKIKNTDEYLIQIKLLKGEKIANKRYKYRGADRAKAAYKKKINYYKNESPYELVMAILYNKSRNKVIKRYKVLNGCFVK